jgi:hypothetical protein
LKSDNSSTPLTQIYCYDNCVKIAKARYTNIDIMLAHIRILFITLFEQELITDMHP